MTELTREPMIIRSMPELLATAKAMESEAIAGYELLADDMRRVGKPELVGVFERLIAEERTHLDSVMDWSAQLGMANLPTGKEPDEVFDDEGMNLTNPALLSAYRAFSVAVRNEERAFLFWTYVSAHAPTPDIALAAERMAREELGHVSLLRRERRLAFHRQKHVQSDTIPLGRLEDRLDAHLQRLAREGNSVSKELAALLQDGSERVFTFGGRPLNPDGLSDVEEISPVALAELLLDFYLGEAERSRDEETRNLAQQYAGQLVTILALLRRVTM